MKKYSFIPILTLLFLIVYFANGCQQNNRPRNLIPQKKYISLLVEFNLLKAYQSVYKDSAKTVALQNKILHHYGVTLKQFDSSRNYYIRVNKEHGFIKEALKDMRASRDNIWNNMNKADSLRKYRPD